MRYEVMCLTHVGRAVDNTIVYDISFTLYAQEALCILVEEIDTKNFLLDILQGRTQIDQGQLFIDDTRKRWDSLEQARSAGIYVVDEKQLVGSMNVADNLYMTSPSFYSRMKFLDIHALHTTTEKCLKEFSLSDIKSTAIVNSLPAHDVYILSILHAYISGCKILVLNSPSFVFYQPAEIKKLQKIVSILKTKGISLLWFSNKWTQVLQNFDRFATIKNGVVTQLSKLTTIPPVEPKSDFLSPKLRYPDVNTEAEVLHCHAISNLDSALPQIDFSLYKGEILGICDDENSVASFMNTFSEGKVPVTGHIELNGSLYDTGSHKKEQIAFISSATGYQRIFPQMDLYDNVTLLVNKPIYNRLGFDNRRIHRHIARSMLAAIHGEGVLEEFTGRRDLIGMKPLDCLKVEIAKWLCVHPKVFVFVNHHNVYNDLTESDFKELLECIHEIGISILIVSASRENLPNLCTRVISVEKE
ncbi:MAG: hypothetical protein ACK5MN_02905 [Lachnospiraceae bacterium]